MLSANETTPATAPARVFAACEYVNEADPSDHTDSKALELDMAATAKEAESELRAHVGATIDWPAPGDEGGSAMVVDVTITRDGSPLRAVYMVEV